MRTKDITVSLVIPAYNEECYLAACLDAVAAQTVKPYEVIVVDNNSTDKTAEIARRYPFVTLLHEPRQGRAYAQAAGFRFATGAVFGRIDADSHLRPDWVETLLRTLGDADAVTGRGWFYDAPCKRFISGLQVFVYQYLQRLISGTFVLWGANMALTKEAWRSVESDMLAHVELDEDIIISLQLHRQGNRIAYEPRLQVDASLRRNQLGPLQLIRYLSTWPRDYWVCGMHVRGTVVALLTCAVAVVSVPGALLVRLAKKIQK